MVKTMQEQEARVALGRAARKEGTGVVESKHPGYGIVFVTDQIAEDIIAPPIKPDPSTLITGQIMR